MRITGLRSRVVAFPLEAPFVPAWGRGRVQSTLEFVLYEVITDDGLVGVGAAGGGLADALAMDRLVAPCFVGQDPADIEGLSHAANGSSSKRIRRESATPACATSQVAP